MQEYRYTETFKDASGDERTVKFKCRASTPTEAEAQRERFRKAYGRRFANSDRGLFVCVQPVRATRR